MKVRHQAAIGCLLLLGACTAMSSVPLTGDHSSKGIAYALPKFHYPTKVLVSYADDKVDPKNAIVDLVIGAPVAVPDTSHRYFLKYNHSIFSEDDFTATTDASGLLLGITSITDDKSLEILKKIAELVKEIAKLSVMVAGEEGIVFEGDIDPSPGGAGQQKLQEVLAKYNASITFETVTRAPELASGVEAAAKADCSIGICYRPYSEYLVTAELPQAGALTPAVKQIRLFAPNSGAMVAVAIDRAAFVRRETSLTFINGTMTELKDKTPSEVLALVTAPVEIVKTIASIPKDILTLRTERINDEAGLLRAQADQARAQAELIQALTELKKTKPVQ